MPRIRSLDTKKAARKEKVSAQTGAGITLRSRVVLDPVDTELNEILAAIATGTTLKSDYLHPTSTRVLREKRDDKAATATSTTDETPHSSSRAKHSKDAKQSTGTAGKKPRKKLESKDIRFSDEDDESKSEAILRLIPGFDSLIANYNIAHRAAHIIEKDETATKHYNRCLKLVDPTRLGEEKNINPFTIDKVGASYLAGVLAEAILYLNTYNVETVRCAQLCIKLRSEYKLSLDDLGLTEREYNRLHDQFAYRTKGYIKLSPNPWLHLHGTSSSSSSSPTGSPFWHTVPKQTRTIATAEESTPTFTTALSPPTYP